MEMILRERSCREIIYHGKTCVKKNEEKRKTKTPSGTADILQKGDSTALKREADHSKTNREGMSDCRDGRIYAGLYTR